MSNNPVWETQDGQKWLAKALDPAGFQQVDLKGMPDQESHNVVVLNYQSQFSVEPPLMYGVEGTDASTYECEIFTYQDPIVFGVSASYPTGTKDPLDNSTVVDLSFGCGETGQTHVPTPPSIKFNSTGVLFPRTCKRFINTQISGINNLSESYDAFKGFAQRHRVIYGSLQALPTCSAQDNSGTISISQQPFIGDNFNNQTSPGYLGVKTNTVISVLGNKGTSRLGVRMYEENDFPDSEDNIRNPASLMTRFSEGAYVPYKLKNPFADDFITTGDATVSYAPFWVVGAAYLVNTINEDWVPMEWDLTTNSFIAKKDPISGNRTNIKVRRLKLSLMSYTGAIKEIIFANNIADESYGTGLVTGTIDLKSLEILNNSVGAPALLADNNSDGAYTTKFSTDGVPESGTNQHLCVYRCGEDNMPRARLPESNITSILCKALNMKGNVTLLFRLGVEIIVNAASVYSPFNHRSPAYDEAALKSYLRVIHRMSDGFYGDAATDTFHTAFYNNLIAQIYEPDTTVDFANRGSYWRGPVNRNY